ncbi:MAG: hypothetical protein LBN29_01375 [Mediterranea sp.]|jgi:hypothetical protein|nr:hypothetical protein [Mediterranea sp.]
MELKIYSLSGTLKLAASTADSSRWNRELMVENAVSCTFTWPAYVPLEVGDYITLAGVRFSIKAGYKPKQKSTQEYTYNVKFYAPEHDAERVMYLNLTDGQYNPRFSLDGSPIEHLRKWVDNLNRITGTTLWRIGTVITAPNKTIEYNNVNCWDAITMQAEAFGTEWWADGYNINLTRCERGTRVSLGYRQGLTSLTQADNTDGVKFFTRLIPLGSTRNIDRSRYGFDRLQLPDRSVYVERNTRFGLYEHVEEDAFSDIYPRYTGTVSSVRQEQKTGEDGNPFTIYYFKDNAIPFNPNDNEIAGLVKHVSFQSGELNGRDFEANWHADTGEWEIINTYPAEDVQVPGGNLIPKVGDAYVPWNFRMPTAYEQAAEQEYAVAVSDYLATYSNDVSKYGGDTDYIYIDKNNVPLQLGQSVRLLSEQYFPTTGYLDNRMTKISCKLDNLSIASIECTNKVGQGWKKSVDSSLDTLQYIIAKRQEETPLDIMKSWDGREITDYRVLSALRAINEITRRSISKQRNDTAAGLIKFLLGLELGSYTSGTSGGKIDAAGNAELLSLTLRGILRSVTFVDGLTGEGFGLGQDADGVTSLTLDRLTVRQTMTVMETLIQKIRSVGGQIIVSAANGKIREVTRSGDDYLISFEQANMFQPHDLMRCSTFTGAALKSYWVEISVVDGDTVTVPVSEFDTSLPEAGDECVLMGNTATAGRQNCISIAATEDGQPRIDVLNGIVTKSLAGALRTRVGNLDGISDSWFPEDNQPHGDGLYSDNAYLRGSFLLLTGEDVLTKFEITEGLIASSIEGLRQDFLEEKGYLSNPTFGSGMDKWDATNEAAFFLVGNKWIWANGNALSRKGGVTLTEWDGGRMVARIKDNYIRQYNADLREKPAFDGVDGDGNRIPVPVYLSFMYRCATAGTLTVGFENVDDTGFATYTPLEVSEEIAVTDGYTQFHAEGAWNGTGDFTLSFTGDIYLYLLVLSTDKLEALKYQYKTLFEQSDRLVKISAAVFDKDKNLLEETGLMVTSQYTGLYAIDGDGNLKALVGAGQDGVKITAANITLEGLVTANENFKILEDGSIETVNANISGTITATAGKIGGFTISGSGLTNTPFGPGNDAYVIFRDDPHGIFAGIGTNVLPSVMGITAAARFENGDTTGYFGTNIAAYFKASGGTDNYAIYMAGGCVAGFALDAKRVSADTTLTNTDCVVSCYNTSTVTLKLPASPVRGKIYLIRVNNAAAVAIDGTNGGKQVMHPNGSLSNSITAGTRGELLTIIWDGQYWLYSTTV